MGTNLVMILCMISVLNAKGTVKMDIPQGPTFEPTYVYDVLKTAKYSSVFLVSSLEQSLHHFVVVYCCEALL